MGHTGDGAEMTAENTYDKVIRYIRKYRMVEAGDFVAAGVSGGADSVCLLHILHRLSGTLGFRLAAVHVDHGVRADSARDAAYVERLCRGLSVPFCLKRADMNGYAAEHGMSAEEAGRTLRYAAFEEVLKERSEGARGRIAVAHNANDRAETMLFHMFRGSGVRGLSSIQPVRERVIRPLLCLEREEIERYLNACGLEYCLDATNEEDRYTRNRIRHHILPYAEREICSGAVAHMNELADILSETEKYLEGQAGRLYDVYVEESGPEGERCLKVRCALLSEDPAMYRRVLLMCMERLTPYRKDVTGQHIADLAALMTRPGSRELSLPYGIRARREYDVLTLCGCGAAGVSGDGDVSPGREYPVVPPAEITVPGEGTYDFLMLEREQAGVDWQNIPQNRYTKWFDYDKITKALVLRTRKPGDYLTIDAALHRKSVRRYMIDEKIPKSQRDSMYILADGQHILWAPGYRISQYYKVGQSTKRILQVRLRGGYYGGTDRGTVE